MQRERDRRDVQEEQPDRAGEDVHGILAGLTPAVGEIGEFRLTGVQLKAWLYDVDEETNEIIYRSEKYISENIRPDDLKLGIRRAERLPDKNSLWRVTPVVCSDPVRKDENHLMEVVRNDTGETVAWTGIGCAVYLTDGEYTLRFPDADIADTVFTVSGVPATVVMSDAEPAGVRGIITDAETGEPVAGADITLKAQGISYGTVSDDNGRYAFDGIPAVDAGISISGIGLVTPLGSDILHLVSGLIQNVLTEAKHQKHVAFFGYLNDGGDEWWAARNAAVLRPGGWFIGHGAWLEVVEGIYGGMRPGTVYYLG